MHKAIVTGASSGIGKAISLRLLQLGWEVYGMSRKYSEEFSQQPHFHFVAVDLANESDTLNVLQKYKKEDISLLVNCAGFGLFEPHEQLSKKDITQMVFLNLTAPMLLSNTFLRSLKKNDGYLININSIEALRASKFAGVYSATKAGLKAFGDSLFEECRKTNLSITNINPDMTQSQFYENLRFDVSENGEEKLFTSDIADAVEHILSMRKGAVVSEYTIRPLRFGIKRG